MSHPVGTYAAGTPTLVVQLPGTISRHIGTQHAHGTAQISHQGRKTSATNPAHAVCLLTGDAQCAYLTNENPQESNQPRGPSLSGVRGQVSRAPLPEQVSRVPGHLITRGPVCAVAERPRSATRHPGQTHRLNVRATGIGPRWCLFAATRGPSSSLRRNSSTTPYNYSRSKSTFESDRRLGAQQKVSSRLPGPPPTPTHPINPYLFQNAGEGAPPQHCPKRLETRQNSDTP